MPSGTVSNLNERLDALEQKLQSTSDHSIDANINHIKGQIRDVMGQKEISRVSYALDILENSVDRNVRRNTREKHLNSNIKVLYHETSPEAATSILSGQRMLRGRSGIAGGGIYFTVSPELTGHKAHHRGVILECQVRVGRVKKIERKGDRSITFTSLLNQGYDSVEIPRSGTEYVVYNYDQIFYINRWEDSSTSSSSTTTSSTSSCTSSCSSMITSNSTPYGDEKRSFTCIKTSSGRYFVVLHKGKQKWMLPGGLCNDSNESYEDTAVRKIKEKSGYKIRNVRHLYTTPDNAAIYLSTFNFANISHEKRMQIFRERTKRHETSDYGYYNPTTEKVESYSGSAKGIQEFVYKTLETINHVETNHP